MLFSQHKSADRSFSIDLPFISVIIVLVGIAAVLWPYPKLAMWFGFAVAGYSAIANDSIQTLGTFMASNRKISWWILWLFIGGILVATHSYGWFADGGDIAFGRLDSIPQPLSYTFLSLVGPIILIILTYLRMPVSTTFLILSAFSSTSVIKGMMMKTFAGYGAAFVSAIVLWSVIAMVFHRREFPSKTYNKRFWTIFQACSTSFLWCTWIMHDTANVAVFLPRHLTGVQATMAIGYLFCVIGLLFFVKGGRIQSVVTEKTDITDIRAATIVDLTYAFVLLVFKNWNHLPMSTTWVFLGLLAGREIALTLFTNKPKPYSNTMKLVGKDIVRASIGLLISLIIAVLIQPS